MPKFLLLIHSYYVAYMNHLMIAFDILQAYL